MKWSLSSSWARVLGFICILLCVLSETQRFLFCRFINLLSPPTTLDDYRVSIDSFVFFLLIQQSISYGFITIDLSPSPSSHASLLRPLRSDDLHSVTMDVSSPLTSFFNPWTHTNHNRSMNASYLDLHL
ncbi:hypothetical protein Rs2_26629 [Raphanus sativus]|nr:hypothetical protein Rs2_26629 [Raphanus sativus]